MNYNRLILEVYESGSTTVVPDPAGFLALAQGLRFDSFFPFGRYGVCSFFIPGNPADAFPFKGGQRLVARNGLTIVWEGGISDIAYVVGAGANGGWRVTGVGYWGRLLSVRGIRKPWADTRIDEATWPYSAAGTAAIKCRLDRQNRLRFVPEREEWANAETAYVEYTAPTGQTIKRVTLDYDLQEGGQAWQLRGRNVTGASNLFTISSSGTGSQDVTLGTPSQQIRLVFEAGATQTPLSDVEYYGEYSNIVVYTETGAIDAQQIATDVVGLVVGLNSSTARIGALTLSLVPFITEGYEMFADLLARAVSYGDASFNSWDCYLDSSERAASPDGKPVLVLEQYPALTDYDVAVRLDEWPVEIVEDTEGLRNYVVVRYRDLLDNRDVWVTPADDANLKDDAAITAAGGQRELVLDAGVTTQTNAINLGRRALAARKDPRYYVSAPIVVVGAIRGKNGNLIPASEVKAGMRLRVEDFIPDKVGVSGAGLTVYITRADYDDASQSVAISCGVPDDLAVILAQIALGNKVSYWSPNGGAVFGPGAR